MVWSFAKMFSPCSCGWQQYFIYLAFFFATALFPPLLNICLLCFHHFTAYGPLLCYICSFIGLKTMSYNCFSNFLCLSAFSTNFRSPRLSCLMIIAAWLFICLFFLGQINWPASYPKINTISFIFFFFSQ